MQTVIEEQPVSIHHETSLCQIYTLNWDILLVCY